MNTTTVIPVPDYQTVICGNHDQFATHWVNVADNDWQPRCFLDLSPEETR